LFKETAVSSPEGEDFKRCEILQEFKPEEQNNNPNGGSIINLIFDVFSVRGS